MYVGSYAPLAVQSVRCQTDAAPWSGQGEQLHQRHERKLYKREAALPLETLVGQPVGVKLVSTDVERG
jgi:hypothetical protein